MNIRAGKGSGSWDQQPGFHPGIKFVQPLFVRVNRKCSAVLTSFDEIGKSFESAKRWLRDCLSHRTCSESPYYLANDKPTRLLDLDAFGDYSTAVRLQDASHIQENYAALSYCWGTIEEQRFITTSSTLNSRMSRIE